MKFIGAEEFQKSLSKNKRLQKFKKEHVLAHEMSKMLVKARIAKGISQAKLASLINTHQANIARMENGKNLPSLNTLDKIARKAYKSYLIPPVFAFLVDQDPVANSTDRKVFSDKDAVIIAGETFKSAGSWIVFDNVKTADNVHRIPVS
jgi:transcriptional regulator with XRE-family HTH domain